jgi:transposase
VFIVVDNPRQHRRRFTPEYRREAARLVIDTGRPIAQVAGEIDVGAQLLGKWVKTEREAQSQALGGRVGEGERAELERLRKENRQLRMENEFLGKASAYFASRRGVSTGSR